MASGRKLTPGEPAKDVVDGVDRLHGGARVLERTRVDAPRGHVDELAQPERGLVLVAAFTVEDHAERGRVAARLRQGAPAHGRAGHRGARNRPWRGTAPPPRRPPPPRAPTPRAGGVVGPPGR